jgi:membrane-associated phospholipid phosphatase
MTEEAISEQFSRIGPMSDAFLFDPPTLKKELATHMRKKPCLIAFSLCQLALFVPLAWWVARHPQPTGELAVTHTLQSKRSPASRGAAYLLSTLIGSTPVSILLVSSTTLLLWKQHRRMEALFTAGIVGSNTLVRLLLKRLIHRPRPSPAHVAMSDYKQTSSFPSGHVGTSVAFWGWVAALSLQHKNPPLPRGLTAVAIICLLIIGPTRVYLGDHWATDVVGAYLLSGGWLGLCFQLYLSLKGR